MSTPRCTYGDAHAEEQEAAHAEEQEDADAEYDEYTHLRRHGRKFSFQFLFGAIRSRRASERLSAGSIPPWCSRARSQFLDICDTTEGSRRDEPADRLRDSRRGGFLRDAPSRPNVARHVFTAREGGGVAESDRFDVVPTQFAMYYTMSAGERTRRFFHTVSGLLEAGGNLIATNVDERVGGKRLTGLGLDYQCDDEDLHEDVGNEGGAEDEPMQQNDVNRSWRRSSPLATACGASSSMRRFQYTFTLVEGEGHGADVGEAADLPWWPTPIPALEDLALERE